MKPVIQTYLGKYFDYREPEEYHYEILEIAHALSHQARFTGHTFFHYSVAQHSVLVAKLVPPELKLTALLHDASEAYLVDIPRPLKALLPDYVRLEERTMSAIAKYYGLIFPFPEAIKRADNMLLLAEKQQLLHKTARDEELWTIPGVEAAQIRIDEMSPEEAKDWFIHMYYALLPREDQNDHRSI